MSDQVGVLPGAAAGMPTHRGVGFVRVLRSEWVKTWTLPATWWGILAAALLNAVIGLWVGYNAEAPPLGGLAYLLTVALPVTQVPLLLVAITMSAGEHTNGSARSTFVAVPKRLPVLAAKVVAMAAVAATAGAVALAVTYLSVKVFADLSVKVFADRPGIALAHPDGDLSRVCVGAVLYLVGIAVLGLGLGAALRRPAAAVVTALTLVLVLEQALTMSGATAAQTARTLLPGWAGRLAATPAEVLAAAEPTAAALQPGPWQGYGILVAWTVLVLAFAAVVERRGDV